MKKLLIALVVLLVLAVAADRITLVVTQSLVAAKLKTSGELTHTPKVHIRGFPFLTQALGGSYDRIDVHAQDIQRKGLSLGTFDVQINGAQVPLKQAFSGGVDDVPVSSLKGRAVVTYLELANDSGILSATVTPRGDSVEVVGKLTYQGVTFSGKATSTVRLVGSSIVVKATSLSILGAHSSLIDRYVVGLLDFSVPIGRLPYGLRLTGASAQSAGVVITASSGPTVLRRQ